MKNFILENLGLLVTLIGAGIVHLVTLVVSWTKISDRLTNTEKRVLVVEQKVENLNPVLLKLQTDMSEVKTSLEFIKVQISSLNDR